MKEVCVESYNIITSLGFTTGENVENILAGKTGIKEVNDKNLSPDPFFASVIDTERLNTEFSNIDDCEKFTRFEKLAIISIQTVIKKANVNPSDKRTLFILSTTKGNIDLLEEEKGKKFEKKRIYLWNTANLLQDFFGFKNTPVIVSNACISGLQAIITGARLIRGGFYDTVVVNGTDIISEFVVSGFNSFKSMSNGPCKPFDKTRDGLSIGEGSGTIVLTKDPSKPSVMIGEGFSSNDANHISGPSRTGEGLYQVISRVQKTFTGNLDFISAHGTATPYNDEMEAIAITRSGLQNVPVNSMKGYWGHTLGAAGVIECIAGIWSLNNNILFNTLGYKEPGTTDVISVINKNTEKQISNFLKIASGFGGCNAALVFYKR